MKSRLLIALVLTLGMALLLVWVYSPDGGSGVSYWSYYVRFSRTLANQLAPTGAVKSPHLRYFDSPEAHMLVLPLER